MVSSITFRFKARSIREGNHFLNLLKDQVRLLEVKEKTPGLEATFIFDSELDLIRLQYATFFCPGGDVIGRFLNVKENYTSIGVEYEFRDLLKFEKELKERYTEDQSRAVVDQINLLICRFEGGLFQNNLDFINKINLKDLDFIFKTVDSHLLIPNQNFSLYEVGSLVFLAQSVLKIFPEKKIKILVFKEWGRLMPLDWPDDIFLVYENCFKIKTNIFERVWLWGIKNLSDFKQIRIENRSLKNGKIKKETRKSVLWKFISNKKVIQILDVNSKINTRYFKGYTVNEMEEELAGENTISKWKSLSVLKIKEPGGFVEIAYMITRAWNIEFNYTPLIISLKDRFERNPELKNDQLLVKFYKRLQTLVAV